MSARDNFLYMMVGIMVFWHSIGRQAKLKLPAQDQKSHLISDRGKAIYLTYFSLQLQKQPAQNNLILVSVQYS